MDEPGWLFPYPAMLDSLPDAPGVMRFRYALRHGTMKIGLYAPRGEDTQGPHTQDELYVVTSGSGAFLKNEERKPFGPGDAIFVEAGAEHCFVDFTDDFSAWAIFWGPDGGKA